MRNFAWWRMTVLVCVGAGLCLVPPLRADGGPEPALSTAALVAGPEFIRLGMTEEQVVSLLGETHSPYNWGPKGSLVKPFPQAGAVIYLQRGRVWRVEAWANSPFNPANGPAPLYLAPGYIPWNGGDAGPSPQEPTTSAAATRPRGRGLMIPRRT